MAVWSVAIGFGGVARLQLQYLDLLEEVEIVAGADVAADARGWFEAGFVAKLDDFLAAVRGETVDVQATLEQARAAVSEREG